MHGDASYIRHNSGTQQQQAPSLNSEEKALVGAFSVITNLRMGPLTSGAPVSGEDPALAPSLSSRPPAAQRTSPQRTAVF